MQQLQQLSATATAIAVEAAAAWPGEDMYACFNLSPDHNGTLARSVPEMWQGWQQTLLKAFVQLHKLLAQLSSSATVIALAAAAASASSGSSAEGSSSSDMQVKWGYLSHVLCSSDWTQTVAVFDNRWPDMRAVLDRHRQASEQVSADSSSSSSSSSRTNANAGITQQQAADDVSQLYSDALELCRALVAATPLPLVCNNPGCETITGVSEASVARKVCAGCRCRYCSAACQTADWRRHKRACKRMAAAGQTCS
jgi:hypothetical protein